jgi:aerobic carbon-monoxide dehydrogenase small subunit
VGEATVKHKISFSVNGKSVTVESYSMERLLDVLRENLKLTGTKEGCGEGECGACSVMLDGELVNSCLVPVAQAEGKSILTIEGVATSDHLHPIQKSFLQHGGAQCGICTPGMVMASLALLQKNPNPKREEIKEALAGNLCRCTGYMKIFDSVEKVVETADEKAAES